MYKLALLAGVVFAFSSIQAHAQTAAPAKAPELEEIVVTAQRQSEVLQKAALSVTAGSGVSSGGPPAGTGRFSVARAR